MNRLSSPSIVAGLAALALAGPASAARVMWSYDSSTPTTVAMTKLSVTFMLDKSPLGVKVLEMVETNTVGAAVLRPAPESALGHGGLRAILGPDGHEHDLYEITSKEDGKALIGALCPGADKGWLAFGPIRMGQTLRVRALGRDHDTGETHLCVTLDYAYHGDWALPQAALPQPDRTDMFNDAPNNRPY